MAKILTPQDLSTVDRGIPQTSIRPFSFREASNLATGGIGPPSPMKIRDASEYEGVDVSFALQGGERALQEGRALRQTGAELLAKGLGNIAENVIFETLKFPGTIASGIGIVTGNEGMINNLWLQGFDALQKPLTELTEVYVPPSVQEKGLWGQLSSPYFWAGEGADAVGTMLSMMIPGRWLATFGLGAKAAKGLAKAGKLGEIAVDGSRILETTGDANKIGKFLVKTLGSTGRGLDFGRLARNIDSGVAVATNTLLESSAEALDTYESLLAQGKTPEEAGEAATKVMMLNMGLLTVSNTLLEKYVFNGFNRLPSVGKQLTAALKGGTPVFKPFQQAGIKFAAGVLAEGFIEEGLQTSFQQEEGSPVQSIVRYMENLQSLFSADPDIEFGKAVILGGLLGGTVGGISGLADVREQKQLLMGTPERTLANGALGRMQKMFGYKAKQAREGLIDIFRPSFENMKLGKDTLKSAISEDGTFDATKLTEETTLFAMSNMIDDIVIANNGDVEKSRTAIAASLREDLNMDDSTIKTMLDKFIPESLNTLSNEQAVKLITLKKDNIYFSRFASNPAGFEMLDAHIEDMVDALQERYAINTGVELSQDKKTSITSDLKAKAKRYKNVYEAATTFNTNTRYNIDVKSEDLKNFNDFIQLTQQTTLDSMTFLEEMRMLAEEIELETKDGQTKINNAKNRIETSKAAGSTADEIKTAEENYKKVEEEVNSSIPNFAKKREDLEKLRADISAREKNIVEFGTASKVQEKWNAYLKVLDEQKQEGRQYFNDQVVDTDNMSSVYSVIYDELINKGYAPQLLTTMPFVSVGEFHITVNDELYTVKQTKDGFEVYNHLSEKTESLSGWKALINKFPNIKLLNIEEFNLEKQRVDKEKADERAALEQQAAIDALTQVSSEVNKRYVEVNNELQSFYTALANTKSSIAAAEEKLKVITKQKQGDWIKDVEQLEDTIKKLKETEASLNAKINSTNNLRLALKAELNGLMSIADRIKAGLSTKFTEESLIALSQTESGIALEGTGFIEEAMTLQQSKKPTDPKFIQQLNDYQARLQQQIDDVTDAIQLATALSGDVRDLINVMTTLVSEIQSTASISEIPDEIKQELEKKFPGITDKLNKVSATNNPDVILKFFADLVGIAKKEYSETYTQVLTDFAKTIRPYVDFNAGITSEVLSQRANEIVSKLSEYQVLLKGLTALRRFATILKRGTQLSKLKSKILLNYEKGFDPQQIPDNEVQDPIGNTRLFETEEDNDKVTSLFNTSGLNKQYDKVSGKDIYVEVAGGYMLPKPTDSIVTQNFFKWLDSNDATTFKVIPYAPLFNDNDFEDITDPVTAKILRDYISNAPDEVKENALYSVIVDDVNGERTVKMYNNLPLINSMMLPSTKFPEQGNPRMAPRAYTSLFLKNLLGRDYSRMLTSEELSSKTLVQLSADSLKKLNEYGIIIEDPSKLTEQTFYETVEPFASLYAEMLYEKGFMELVSEAKSLNGSSLNDRKFLDVSGVSKGFHVVAKSIDDNFVVFDSEAMGLKYTQAGNPENFSVLKPNYRGVAKLNNVTYTGLQPGRLYVKKFDTSTLIPVETGTLFDEEVDSVLYMLSMYGGNKKSLNITIPNLQGSIDVRGMEKSLDSISILPASRDRVSLISMIMNWGFKPKGDPSPFDIYVRKGRLIFNGTESIALEDLKKAYLEGDEVTLQSLKAFLKNKRVNANYNFINVRNNFYDFVVIRNDKGKPINIKAVQKQGSYIKHILDRASFYGVPKDILDLVGLPSSAQKYIMFKDFETKVDVEAFKQRFEEKRKFTPKPKATKKKGDAISPVINALRESNSITEFRTKAAAYITDSENAKLFNNITKRLGNESGPMFDADKLLILNDKSIVGNKADVIFEEDATKEGSELLRDILNSMSQEETPQGEEGSVNITMGEALNVLWEQAGGKPETQEQPEASAIKEARKADIEKSKKLTKEYGEVAISDGKNVEQKLAQIGKFFKDNFGWNITYIKASKENDRVEFTIDGKQVNLPAGANIRLMAGGAYAAFTMEDVIHAKYNAEYLSNSDLGKSILKKLNYKTINRLPNGNVKGGQDGWKIRFNIKNPKTGESYYDDKDGGNRLVDNEYNKRAETLINFLLNYFGSNKKADPAKLENHYFITDPDGTSREPFKHLAGGEIGESDFTIYIGSADDVLKFISDIRTKHPEILKLLHQGNKSQDVLIDDIFKGRIEGRNIGFTGYHIPLNLDSVIKDKHFIFEHNNENVILSYEDSPYIIITKSDGTVKGYGPAFDKNLKKDYPDLYENIRSLVGFELYGTYLTGSNNEFVELINKQPSTEPTPTGTKRTPVAGDTLTSDSGKNYRIKGFTDKGGVQWEDTVDLSKGVWAKGTFNTYIKEGRLKYDNEVVTPPSGKPTPSNVSAATPSIDFSEFFPEDGNKFIIDGVTYDYVDFSQGRAKLIANGNSKLLPIKKLRDGLIDGSITFIEGVAKSVADYNKILSDAIQRGIIDEINCNR